MILGFRPMRGEDSSPFTHQYEFDFIYKVDFRKYEVEVSFMDNKIFSLYVVGVEGKLYFSFGRK